MTPAGADDVTLDDVAARWVQRPRVECIDPQARARFGRRWRARLEALRADPDAAIRQAARLARIAAADADDCGNVGSEFGDTDTDPSTAIESPAHAR